MRPQWVLILVSLTTLFICSAHTETVGVAGISLVIEPPPGYCALDANSGDRELFIKQRELLRPNELVQVSVPCDQLEAMKTGKIRTYSRWAQVQVINPGSGIRVLHISRSELIATFTKAVERKPIDIAQINLRMRQKLLKEDLSMAASKMEIVGSDARAAYMSMFGNLQSEEGSSRLVAFGAITLVRGLPVSIYAYAKREAPAGELPTEVAMNYLTSVLDKNPE
jgi:hypothetical protein